MKPGKRICETLKGIRADIARANDIDYNPTPCDHKGDCAGTCPACESEVRWLEQQLQLRQRLGKVVTIAGLSLGIGAMAASCNLVSGKMVKPLEGDVPDPNYIDTSEIHQLEGDVVNMPPDSVEPCKIEKNDSDKLIPPLRGKVPYKPKPKKGENNGDNDE